MVLLLNTKFCCFGTVETVGVSPVQTGGLASGLCILSVNKINKNEIQLII